MLCSRMGKLCRIIPGMLFLAMFLVPVWAKAEEKSVTWMEVVFPPGYIHEGPLAGMGYEDVITDILTENLTEYHHDKMMGNLARMTHEYKQGKPVCNVALFKTPEREEHMLFSIPSTFTLPNGLITTRKKWESFNNASSLGLAHILKDEIRLGVSRGRSYGKSIDAVLEAYPARLFHHSGKDVFESLLKMLLSQRLDAMLGLPEEVLYVAERMGVRDEIVTIALAESEGTYDAWLGHVACSKTDWGKKIIGQIDEILLKERPTERYRGAYERWLDPNSLENYRRLYNEVFLKTGDDR